MAVVCCRKQSDKIQCRSDKEKIVLFYMQIKEDIEYTVGIINSFNF